MDTKQYAIKCFKDEAQSILDLIPQLDDNFNKAVDLIFHCTGRCIVTGVGKSGHIGQKIAATLASTGTPSFFVNPLDAYHGDLGMFTSEDVVIAISNSGNTDELLRIIPFLLDRKIPIIGMSGDPKSLLAKYSTAHLNVSVKREACPLNLAPTSSTTATLAMGDALAVALMKVRNFKATDFAQFHPGGTLGKRLLSTVAMNMVSENLPVVSPETLISDTSTAINKTKQGIAVVLSEGDIVGVVSDGDIRRVMKSKEDVFFKLKVKDIMCTSPKTINEHAKIIEASNMMRKYNIHALIVVDDSGKLAGIIDTFSCLL